MHLLSINHDVLSHILSFLTVKDALQLSAASRKVHLLAQRQAFSTVSVTSQTQLVKFCTYMLDDVPNRLYWLRALDVCRSALGITGEYIPELEEETLHISVSPIIADLFAQASMLRYLSLAGTEHLAMSESRIVDTLAGLSNLKELRLFEAGPCTPEILNRLRSRPRKLLVSHLSHGLIEHPSYFMSIAAFQNLQVLDLSEVHFDGSIPRSDSGTLLQWSAVRHLSVMKTMSPMAPFVSAFPNIRTLILWCVHGIPPSVAATAECWQSLDHVGGYARDFTCWRITCPVRWLEIDVAVVDDEHVMLIVDAVRNMTPTILTLNIYLYTELSVWARLADAIPILKYLDLVAMNWTVSNSQNWLDHAPFALQAFNLTCVRIYLTFPSDPSLSEDSGSTETTWRKMFEQRLPAVLAASIPSLRYIAIEMECDMLAPLITRPRRPHEEEERRPENSTWWRVTGLGKEQKLQKLLPRIGARVHALLHTGDLETIEKIDEILFPS